MSNETLTQAEAARAVPAMLGFGPLARIGRLAATVLALGSPLPSALAQTAPGEHVDFKTLFVEAEGEVEIHPVKYMPPKAHFGFPVFWLDNQRIMYVVRELGDWKAQKDERSKIVIVDVDTGAVEETPYRGDLECVSPEGGIRVQDYPVPTPNSAFRLPGDSKEDSHVYLVGKVGDKELARVGAVSGKNFFNRYTCQFQEQRAHGFGKEHISLALRPGDGTLDEPTFSSPDKNIRLISPEGKVLWSIEPDKVCEYFTMPQFLPWLSRYFVRASWGSVVQGCMNPNKNSWLFSSNGVETKPLPPLIQELSKARRTGANGSTYWARRGMYVFVQYSRPEALDGLYRVDEVSGQLKRVLRHPWGLENLSPDGCRSLVMVKPAAIVELCKGVQR